VHAVERPEELLVAGLSPRDRQIRGGGQRRHVERFGISPCGTSDNQVVFEQRGSGEIAVASIREAHSVRRVAFLAIHWLPRGVMTPPAPTRAGGSPTFVEGPQIVFTLIEATSKTGDCDCAATIDATDSAAANTRHPIVRMHASHRRDGTLSTLPQFQLESVLATSSFPEGSLTVRAAAAGPPSFEGCAVTVIRSPAVTRSRLQPRRCKAPGGSSSTRQPASRASLVTAMVTTTWGFTHSTAVTVPVKTMMLSLSYSSARGWCPDARGPKVKHISAAKMTTRVDMGWFLRDLTGILARSC
jgi:hypothetical protein